eukprot:c18884_g1_i1.p1 GENE.c18884_g1_i1~~c18884_g1_i1.p1  ORF type:complete len:354 (-),score=118.67 c18884_g1_i1:100-1161(-)
MLMIKLLFFILISSNYHQVYCWTGQSIHENILNSLIKLSKDINLHENEEHDKAYEESLKLQQQLHSLQSLTQDDSIINGSRLQHANQQPTTSYDFALKSLVNSFFHIDELMNRMLQPAQYQLNYIEKDCESNLKKYSERSQKTNNILQKVYTLKTEFHKMNHLAISDSEKKAFHAKIYLQLTSLIQNESTLLNRNETLRALSTKTPQENFDRIYEFLEVLANNYEKESISIRKSINETKSYCRIEKEKIQGKIKEVYQHLEGAEKNLDSVINVFAHAAKNELSTQIDDISKQTKEDSKIREVIKGLLKSASESNEIITLSLCQNDCSGHGSCWTGVCRCDNGWSGVKCDDQIN